MQQIFLNRMIDFPFFLVPEEDKIYSRAQYNKNVWVSKKELFWLESNKRK